MKQLNKKRDPLPCSESRCFPAALWQRQGTLWRCCDAEITHRRWSFFSSSFLSYHEFNSCGQSFCNPGVVMLYVVEYRLKLLASTQTRRLWCGIDAREFPSSHLSLGLRSWPWLSARCQVFKWHFGQDLKKHLMWEQNREHVFSAVLGTMFQKRIRVHLVLPTLLTLLVNTLFKQRDIVSKAPPNWPSYLALVSLMS